MTKQQVEAALLAFAHSFLITGTAILCGLVVQAYTDGSATTIPALWTYVQAHWLGFLIAQLIAPTWRAYAAAKKVGP
jgi:hypothetical protein